MNDTRRNNEGYSDPTAHTALSRIEQEERRARQLKKTLSDVCALSGYRLKGQITLVDRRSGHTVRL